MSNDIAGNPIGEAKEEEVKTYVRSLAKQWVDQNDTKPSWWQFKKRNIQLSKGMKFLLDSVDLLVQYVDKLITNGPDKKATVLAGLNALYDLIITDLLPIWLKPVAKGIKKLLVSVLLSLLIDFIVDKYKKGSWNNSGNTNGTPEEKPQI